MRFSNRLKLLSVALGILLLLPLLGWGPDIRDTSTGNQLTPSAASFISADVTPRTVATVVAVIDSATGRVLYGRRAYERHAIGSITKLMTAMLAIKHLKLDKVVTVSRKAASVPGSSMYLVPGERLTVKSLLYGLLIPSGNDAAEELAETIAGSDAGFARLMNSQAHAYGLTCSHYVTPNGLDAKGQYSCAADATKMAQIVLRQPLLSRIVDTRQIEVPGATPGLTFNLVNTNLLLGYYPGAIGVKTGTTDAAGASVVAAARRYSRTVIATILGSSEFGRFTDAASMLNFAFGNYAWPPKQDTMWSTASLIRHSHLKTAAVPRWEENWISVSRNQYLSAPYDPH